ncbi:carbohydrate ABC transporter permease [Streptomyces albus]|nr:MULTISPECIES: sugar ABC transporter permease [Streptomyces]EPD95576.1 hypothetical protein HMPREF1486_01773 [Streptomyces sp. HPH0547]KPC87352.1 sugar ABC transporter permease [Streptomyces sp. NRRL F-6602]UVN57090.1 sugar ABC transporter permease [Streptomyces albus]GHJ23851.1 sugar ABC transporter permease [Streptomyces albus]
MSTAPSPVPAGVGRGPDAAAGPAEQGARRSRARTRRSARRGAGAACAALMTPFFLLLVLVFLLPVGVAVWLSFFGDDQPELGFGPERTVFTGLRSYRAVLTDPTFLRGLGTTALYCLVHLPLMVVLSLALALLLDSGAARLRRTAQLALFLPHAVPGIIAAVIWLYLYTPGLSPVIGLLDSAGVRVDLLGVDTVLPSVVNIALWSNLGYNVVIFYAALQAVPREVTEAALVDGAGPVRTALLVKVPLVRGSAVMVVLFTLIWSLQLFTEPMLLSQASPVVGARWTPNMYIYDAAFTRNNYGLAAAASVVLLAVTVALSYAVGRWSTRGARPGGPGRTGEGGPR